MQLQPSVGTHIQCSFCYIESSIKKRRQQEGSILFRIYDNTVITICLSFFFQLGIQRSDLKGTKGFTVSQTKNISTQVTEVTVPMPLNLFPRSPYSGAWMEGSLNESFTQSVSWDRSDSNISVGF